MTDRAFKWIWNPATDDSGSLVYEAYLGKTRLGLDHRNLLHAWRARASDGVQRHRAPAIDFAGNVSVSNHLTINTLAPVADGSGSGIAGTYFGERDFSQYRLTRTDPNIEFAWVSSPAEPGSDDPFSIRWEGVLVPKYEEMYTLYLYSDGAARLWLNGTMLIDNPGGNERTAALKLHAGQSNQLRVEYSSGQDDAAAVLSWASLSTPKQTIPTSQLSPAFVDDQPPSAPSNLQVGGISQTTIALSWDHATDNIGVVRYDVFAGGDYIDSTTDTSYTVTGLEADTQYTFSVVAVDGVPLVSAFSNSRTAHPQAPHRATPFPTFRHRSSAAPRGSCSRATSSPASTTETGPDIA